MKGSCARFRVPLIFNLHQTIHGGSPVFVGEMGLAHHHLQGPAQEQFCHGAQIHSGHIESTGKGMTVAMPRVSLDLRLIKRGRKPNARSLTRIATAGGREDRISSSWSRRAL